MTNALDEAIMAFKKQSEEARANWVAHKTVDSSQIMRAQSDIVLPGLRATAKAYAGHAFVGRSFLAADPAAKKPGTRYLRISGKLFRPVVGKVRKNPAGTNKQGYVFPDFTPGSRDGSRR
ncbi:MAG: hypothetical protein JJU21_08305 [Salinarimonas sp.]|nr:hypothetical protein [Salinarimonas sp.]